MKSTIPCYPVFSVIVLDLVPGADFRLLDNILIIDICGILEVWHNFVIAQLHFWHHCIWYVQTSKNCFCIFFLHDNIQEITLSFLWGKRKLVNFLKHCTLSFSIATLLIINLTKKSVAVFSFVQYSSITHSPNHLT